MMKYYDEIYTNGKIENKDQWKSELKDVLRNRLEPEFSLRKDSTWHLIIDKNNKGVEAYGDYLDEKCLFDEERV